MWFPAVCCFPRSNMLPQSLYLPQLFWISFCLYPSIKASVCYYILDNNYKANLSFSHYDLNVVAAISTGTLAVALCLIDDCPLSTSKVSIYEL